MKWHRLADHRLQELSRQFPAVAVIGARQVGKTTLVREAFPFAAYKDLESPLVRLRFAEDAAYELKQLGDLAILDEAQTVPEVFTALRGAIDDRREDRRCHFCVLGSAQPALIRERTMMTNGWIAKQLHMGDPSRVCRYCSAGRENRVIQKLANTL
jgi:hypothetical protein